MNTAEKQLRTTIHRLIQGLQNNDLETIEGVYAQDRNLLVFLEGPKMKITGWKAVRRAIARFLRTHTHIRSRLNKDSRFVTDGRLGVFYGTYQFQAVNRRTGKPIRWTARNTFVFRKRGRKWEVIHEHDSFPAHTS